MKSIREIIQALGMCSAIPGPTEGGKHVCDLCPYGGDCDTGNRLLADAAALLAAWKWRDPVNDPPKSHVPVIVARYFDGKALKIEQGMLTVNGWWKVYGTNVKRIIAWKPMPGEPDEQDTPWLKEERHNEY